MKLFTPKGLRVPHAEGDPWPKCGQCKKPALTTSAHDMEENPNGIRVIFSCHGKVETYDVDVEQFRLAGPGARFLPPEVFAPLKPSGMQAPEALKAKKKWIHELHQTWIPEVAPPLVGFTPKGWKPAHVFDGPVHQLEEAPFLGHPPSVPWCHVCQKPVDKIIADQDMSSGSRIIGVICHGEAQSILVPVEMLEAMSHDHLMARLAKFRAFKCPAASIPLARVPVITWQDQGFRAMANTLLKAGVQPAKAIAQLPAPVCERCGLTVEKFEVVQYENAPAFELRARCHGEYYSYSLAIELFAALASASPAGSLASFRFFKEEKSVPPPLQQQLDNYAEAHKKGWSGW